MKKIILSAFINICFITLSFSQINWGYKVGLNFTKSNILTHNSYPINTKFNTGLIARLKLNENIFINMECLYSLKEFDAMFVPFGTTDLNLSYLSFPILFEYKTTKGFYFHLGPELSYLIGAKLKRHDLNSSVLDNYKKLDICLAGGLGFNLSKRFALETRYLYGLIQIGDNPIEAFRSEYNRTLQFNLIYRFN